MGYKSKSKQINNFNIKGLIFDSEEDYLIFKNLDKNIYQTVKSVNDGIIDLKDVFNNVKNINVKETYYDACEELDGLFKNATSLLMYEGSIFQNDFKVGCCFLIKLM